MILITPLNKQTGNGIGAGVAAIGEMLQVNSTLCTLNISG